MINPLGGLNMLDPRLRRALICTAVALAYLLIDLPSHIQTVKNAYSVIGDVKPYNKGLRGFENFDFVIETIAFVGACICGLLSYIAYFISLISE